VGEPLQSQLIITSNARPLSTPIVLSEVKIVFEGGLRPVWLMDNSDPSVAQSSQTKIEDVALRDSVHSTDLSYPASPTGGIVSLVGKCDLTLAPGQSRVYNFTSVPRESGDVRLDSITLLLEQETFSLAYVVPGHEHEGGVWIKQSTTGPKLRQFGFDRNVTAAKIHPKPPKIRIETPTLNDTYYTDERVELNIDIINNEDEAADVEVEARLLGGAENSSSISWTDLSWAGLEDPHADILAKEPTQGGTSYLEKRPIGLLSKQDTTKLKLLISNTSNPFDYELEITATYHLLSDPETPIIKISTVDVTFIRPFEGHCDFLPRLHPDRWPNFFHVNGDVDPESGKPSPSGIPQRYSLATKLIPLAQESLVVTDVYPSVATTHGDITCTVHPTPTPFAPAVLPPDHFGEFDFTLDVQKQHLEDRRPSTLTLALQIHWHRPSTPSQTIKTHLPIPRFLVPHEPRVLATAAHLPPATKPLPLHALPPPIHLTYTLENPSMHTLPFALDMSASEDFAFSGPKARTLHLLPYTRQIVNYVLLPAKSGVWIRPSLEVMDTYFSTKVRVFPGGKGVKRGRGGDRDGEEGGRGIMVWVGDGSSEGKDGNGPGDGVEGQSWVVGRKV
jgi:trafficking protein particle complex subunit 11